MIGGEEIPHDTLRYLIALKAKEIFGISCIALQEVHAEAGTRRADLVLITEMSPYPYVRIVEVKTKAEDVWKAFEQLLWFKERGLANFYFVALPKKEHDKYLHSYDNFYEKIIGLIVVDTKPSLKGLEANFEVPVKPKFEIRKTDWDELYMELEKRGKHKLVERLRKTVGRTPVG